MTVSQKIACPTQSGRPGSSLERYEGWMQTMERDVYSGSRIKQRNLLEGATRNVSLEAVLGKTHCTEF